MKRLFKTFVAMLLITCIPIQSFGAVRVKGYIKKDGTYVSSHYRSNPDGYLYNNYSYFKNTAFPYPVEVKTPSKNWNVRLKEFDVTNPLEYEVYTKMKRFYDTSKPTDKKTVISSSRFKQIEMNVNEYFLNHNLIDFVEGNTTYLKQYSDEGSMFFDVTNNGIAFMVELDSNLGRKEYMDDFLLFFDVLELMTQEEFNDLMNELIANPKTLSGEEFYCFNSKTVVNIGTNPETKNLALSVVVLP